MYGAIGERKEHEKLADAIMGRQGVNVAQQAQRKLDFSPDQVFFASPSNRDFVLHILRNPDGYSDETIREMRLKVCDELERLWRLEGTTRYLAAHLAGEYGLVK